VTEPIVQATINESGTLTVRYEGRVGSETQKISPAPVPVPAPGAKTMIFRWSDADGLVLDGAVAAQVGTRLTFSDPTALLHLIASVKEHGPITVALVPSTRPTGEERGAGAASPAPNRAVERPSTVDLSVLTDPRPGAFLILAAQHWAPSRSLPLQPPLSRVQIDTFAEESPNARYIADTVARSWREYVLAGGTTHDQFKPLVQALLIQWERKNSSAAPGFLRDAARPERWGLYRHEIRWYDQDGHLLIGSAGVYWDPTYASLLRPDWALRCNPDGP
jgi:hypothetical protein